MNMKNLNLFYSMAGLSALAATVSSCQQNKSEAKKLIILFIS